jgi:hypothetical protein
MTESETLAMASGLVRRERARSHLDTPNAIKTVARSIGLTPGSLENLVRGRAKRITLSVAAAVRRAMIRELENEVARLTHELELVRAGGADPRSLEMAEIETCLARATALLNEGAR